MIKIAAPVYKFENEFSPYIIVLHQSSKHRPQLGIWQATFFESDFEGGMKPAPTGDSEFGSLEDALQYIEDQGYRLVEEVEDQQKIKALFGIKDSNGIVDSYYEKNKADKGSSKEARDVGENVQLVDRDALGDPTQRGEITQLEDEKVGDSTENRTQEH